MSEKAPQQPNKLESVEHHTHEYGDVSDDSNIDAAWKRLQNRTLGGAATFGNVLNPALQDMSVNHEVEKQEKGCYY